MQVWKPLNLSAVCPPSATVLECTDFGLVYLNLLVQLYSGSVDQRKQEECGREAEPVARDGVEYDFIVVGAGAAGCVVANRLSENPRWKVLLLEAGPEEPDITRVPGLATLLPGSNIDWQYATEPNGKSCLAYSGGRCAWPRGKTMGGSTSINSLGYKRGNRADYDLWARWGNDGWSYADVLPYFIKSEANLNKYEIDSDYHGSKGEQFVSWLPYMDEPANMMIEAYHEIGIPIRDYNGAKQFGAMQMQSFAVDGERVSANVAFIQPIRYKRLNLFVKTNSEVTKILIDGQRNAYGVRYLQGSKSYTAYAKKEVIICAGVINSPKLLMLSGIGPRDHLESLNISVVQDLAVGKNLHDHITFNGLIIALSKETATSVSEHEILRAIKEFAQLKIKKGPLASTGATLSGAFLQTEPLLEPNVQFQAIPIPNLREYLQDPMTSEQVAILPSSYYDALISRIIGLVPKSRGELLLNKSNPHGPPLLFANYLSDDRDLTTLVKAARIYLTLENTAAFRSRGAYFVRHKMAYCEDYVWGTDDYIACLVRHYTDSTHHQVGTCKMGPRWDAQAVVDSRLRVHGLAGLRVIDASIMPAIIRGNTNAPSIMIGERGVDFVIKYWKNRTNDYCF